MLIVSNSHWEKSSQVKMETAQTVELMSDLNGMRPRGKRKEKSPLDTSMKTMKAMTAKPPQILSNLSSLSKQS